MTTLTSDYDEPWSANGNHVYDNLGHHKAQFNYGENARRTAACVSACAGMADPAKEIASLRGERDCLNRELSDICRVADAHTADEACEVIRAMREVIREAAKSLEDWHLLWKELCPLASTRAFLDGRAVERASTDALAKLQPFIKP